MDETFSGIELITECMSDNERTDALVKAIEGAVKPGDCVLDSGTGSAVLALAAARAGARKVIALEFDPYVAKLAYENILRNGLEKVVQIMLTDARTVTFEPDTKFDVVIMEMLTTGMVDEYQVWTVNNLHQKGVLTEKTIFIPKRQDTFIVLSHKNFEAQGFNMRMVRHLWSWLPNNGLDFLSEKQILNSISFDQENDINFRGEYEFSITKAGILNSVHLSSKTCIDDSSEIGDTLALNAPVVFPLEEDLEVKVGDVIKIEVSYLFGNGYRNFNVKIL